MYHNVSLNTSVSSSMQREPKVDLENIEELQDAWSRRYETRREPPLPPLLNSPRSLHVCTLAKVDPRTALHKLSLKQHLFRIVGNPNALYPLPSADAEAYKNLMQLALRAFREASIGLGTSQEKLSAYMAFQKQEESRVPLLASLRDARRQTMATEISQSCHRSHRGASELASLTTDAADAAWDGRANLRKYSRLMEPQSLRMPRAEEDGQRSHRSVASDKLTDVTTCSLSTTAALASFSAGCGDGRYPVESLDFPRSPSTQLPYKPRDVSVMSNSHFANRSTRSAGSNPCRAVLPTSLLCTPSTVVTVDSPTPPRPSEIARDVSIDVDREVSLIERDAREGKSSKLLGQQDLSVVSIDSTQLDMLLHMTGTTPPATAKGMARVAVEAVLSASVEREPPPRKGKNSTRAVTLFQGSVDDRAGVSSPVPAVHPSRPVTSPLLPEPRQLPMTGQLHLTLDNAALGHKARAPSSLTCCAPPESSPLLPRRESGLNGKHVQDRSELHQKENQGSQKTVLHRQDIPLKTTAAPAERSDIARGSPNGPRTPPLPPPITPLEEKEGFLYICVNPKTSAVCAYAGERQPLASMVNR